MGEVPTETARLHHGPTVQSEHRDIAPCPKPPSPLGGSGSTQASGFPAQPLGVKSLSEHQSQSDACDATCIASPQS